jgi:hypothetical protein
MGRVTSGETTDRRLVDIAATIVLLIGHVVLAFFAFLVVGLSVMGTDPCGYVQCGDQRWAGVGVETAMFGGLVLVVADLVVSTMRMARGRLAWFVPVIFCVAQVGLGIAGFAIVSLAGPV